MPTIYDETESPRGEQTTGLSEADLEARRTVFREVAADLDRDRPERDAVDHVELDYDLFREIVREEVRCTLEEAVR